MLLIYVLANKMMSASNLCKCYTDRSHALRCSGQVGLRAAMPMHHAQYQCCRAQWGLPRLMTPRQHAKALVASSRLSASVDQPVESLGQDIAYTCINVKPSSSWQPHEVKCQLAWELDGQPAGDLLACCYKLPASQHTNRPDSALLAVAVRIEGPTCSRELLAHWACVREKRGRWKAPPAGWHTVPEQSTDAGNGAWQTSLQLVENSDNQPSDSTTYSLLLQVPLTEALRNPKSGIALVFHNGAGQWLKQVVTPSQHDNPRLQDIFIPVTNLPDAPPALVEAVTGKISSQQAQQHSAAANAMSQDHQGFATSDQQVTSQAPVNNILPTKQRLGVDGKAGKDGGSKDTKDKDVQADSLRLQWFILNFNVRTVQKPAQDINVVDDGVRYDGQPCHWMVDHIAEKEPGSQRSLMHRYNTAAELVGFTSGVHHAADRQSAIAAVAVWLRLSASRLLPWNKNYNVKPREISAAQDRLCSALTGLWSSSSISARPLLQLALRSVGRGGAGDVGQRVRDEILEIQQNNHCKGGMMEEWHQKLHNNTSPDDVVICEALLAYCQTLDIRNYWSHLTSAGITAQRLASFDRPIHNEPHFTQDQVPGLIKDLTAYLQTLRAVHCGTDLASAVAGVMGYQAYSKKSNTPVIVHRVTEVATPELQRLVDAALHMQQALSVNMLPTQRGDSVAVSSQEPSHLTTLLNTICLMDLLLEARRMIRPFVLGGDASCGGRHRDVLFLDMALEGAGRAAMESAMDALRWLVSPNMDMQSDGTADVFGSSNLVVTGRRSPEPTQQLAGLLAQLEAGSISLPKAVEAQMSSSLSPDPQESTLSLLLSITRLAVEGAALSSYPNEDLTWALKWLRSPALAVPGASMRVEGRALQDLALQLLSVMDRLKRALAVQSSSLSSQLQPTAERLAHRLGISPADVSIFSEEVVRGTAAAPLAQVLSMFDPWLRRLCGGGGWQVISRGAADNGNAVTGVVAWTQALSVVQHATYPQPTVLLVDELEGHEDVPEGCVAVLSLKGHAPDMLSHSAVRARNMNVLLATCYSPEVAQDLAGMVGQSVTVHLNGQDLTVKPLP